MKTLIRTIYGSPDLIKIIDKEIPQPKNDEILIKVFAATVNRTDCGIFFGKPFIIRFFSGLFKPKMQTTGTDFSGIIVKTGKDVDLFRVGDKVWGFDDLGLSSHSQYILLSQFKPIKIIPEGLSFEEAAASPEGAHYAYNFLNKVNLKKGDKVLLNGATGAIGSAALQFLKYNDVYVTATCNTTNIELIKSLGADKVIDYTKEDFTKDIDKYDFVFDAVGKSTFAKCKPLLKDKGFYISSELGPKAQNILLALFTPIFGGKKVIFPIPTNIKRSLEFINTLIEQGKFKPLIDRIYPLEKINDAYKYVVSGNKIGNVIIKMDDN